ncbi:zinc finger CCCH domain-containing protein 10-like [Diorhabda sublineata]|uniref:zinc finger CCCH domain-containing protein 10-like n=1 Tax=Diorhabda sublineata TaxID=1163346 RepID=UPI0024E101AB|nr:zinc finger CCCH domain-containing protein 10-like [Diorhabda sublineata]XP_056648963.1 zinc finger CCCH domain-containing protein 10-like [Diorhabda sublineata]
MSESSEDASQSNKSNEKDNICRDFLRGTCNRNNCKYKHENEIKPLNFCHDFQNNVCPRPFCKFIHCSPNEADHYKRTGQMTPQILSEVTLKNLLPDPPPVCDQFRRGQCRRSNCKYRHITKEQEEAEIVNGEHQKQRSLLYDNDNGNIAEPQLVPLESVRGILRRNGVSYDEYKDDGLPLIKRRYAAMSEQEMISCDFLESRLGPYFKGYFAGVPPQGYFAGNPPPHMLARANARTLMLVEENAMLLKENARLKKQVSNLTATNEFLLEQNAALRVNDKRNGTVNVPAVSITNSQTPQQVNRTVIASVATVPVSLATVSTCNPVSITGCPAVSMAPAQILANSQQILVTTNPTTQLAIANSSQAQLAIAQQNLATNLAAAQQAAQPQLTSQAQHMANQQMALATAAGPQLTTQAQQLALAAGTNQQLTSQAQQLALASTNQQLSTQPQQLTVTNVPQQLALASTNQQLIAQQNLASEIHRSTSQAIAMSNAASQPMVSYPIMTQSINHAMTH